MNSKFNAENPTDNLDANNYEDANNIVDDNDTFV